MQQFFEEMKPDSGLAFVVVMHLSPDFESQLAGVLQQKTKMPVVQVTEAVKVQPDHVYVIPPNHQLTFEDSMLRLMPPQQAAGRRVTIDLFFRTLAHAYGQRAVSIILSGTDSDGVIGLKHIRAQGGVTIAQEPEEAEFDSMPQNAINTGMVDWVLHVADMPPRLLEFVRNEHAMQLPPEIIDAAGADVKVEDAPGGETVSDETRGSDDEEALGLVLTHVRLHTGHDFGHYKRATVLRRIARRLQVNSLESIPRYLEFLRKHPAELEVTAFINLIVPAECDKSLKPGEDFTFFPMPKYDASMPDAQFVSGDLFVGAADTKNKPATLALLEFLGSADAQAIWAKRGGYIAPNAKVQPDVYPDENDRRAAELWPKSADVPAGYDLDDWIGGEIQVKYRQALAQFVRDQDVDKFIATMTRVDTRATD